ncbi:MAG: hypothetical protein IT355_18675 [Gemmatimonadaceae bacterium]|nr:hypothetical protein [Gemmatimonadaceae bacterium]
MSRLSLPMLPVLLLSLVACSKKSGGPTAPVGNQKTSFTTLNPVGSGTNIEARTSQIVTNGAPPAQLFDDFSFTGGSTIRTVGWQGIYCVQAANAAAPAPTASAFTVAFYPDASGRPNIAAPIQVTTLTLAQANQVFDRNVSNLSCGSATNVTYAFYSYSATLATPFVAAAGVKYWMSVQATTPSYDVYWGWRNGTTDNSLSVQLFTGAFTTYPADRAYSLTP